MTVNSFYQSLFHCKTYKISLDAGCTCPTRDGTLDTRGCIFCSGAGSGDFAVKDIEKAKRIVAGKINTDVPVKYIAYFQSFTNTYGDLNRLCALWEQALSAPDVVGLALGTRPDCLSKECVDYLGRLAEKTFVQVELGFQTAAEDTAKYIRRGFDNSVFIDAVERLHRANPRIHVVAHVIFGLPGETPEQMMNTVRTVIDSGADGIKITCLYVLKNTDLELEYHKGTFSVLDEDEYYNLLECALKLIPSKMVIHRLTGDPPKRLLVAPLWTMDKKRALNRIKNMLSKTI